jgi:hypothetical protein
LKDPIEKTLHPLKVSPFPIYLVTTSATPKFTVVLSDLREQLLEDVLFLNHGEEFIAAYAATKWGNRPIKVKTTHDLN